MTSTKITRLALIGALGASLCIGAASCSDPKSKDPSQESQTPKEQVIPVVAQQVGNAPFTVTKNYSGTLEGERQASVIAKVTEQVVEIPVRIGQSVREGDLLMKLDRSGPSSRYHQAESAFLNTERTLKRMEALFESGAVSRQALDDTGTQFDVAKAEFEAAKSLVDLTSPINGTVTAIDYSVGDVTTPGIPAVTVAEFDRLTIVFHVSEADLQLLEIGIPVNVYSELRSDLIRSGEIISLSKSADISTRTFEAKAKFENTEDQWFRPGMFSVARVLRTTPEAVIFVPRSAIVHGALGEEVFVVDNGLVHRRSVETGISNDLSVIVTGLAPTDSVVTMGTNRLDDGAKVMLVDEARFAVTESGSSESQQ